MGTNTQNANGGWRALAQDALDLLLIVWALPLVVLALVLPLAALHAVVRAVLQTR